MYLFKNLFCLNEQPKKNIKFQKKRFFLFGNFFSLLYSSIISVKVTDNHFTIGRFHMEKNEHFTNISYIVVLLGEKIRRRG